MCGDYMDSYYMNLALRLAHKAFCKGEVPVGAVIVKDNKILSTAYNKKNKSKKTIDHAEIIAITKANKKIKDWRLTGCVMYFSLNPCEMCMGALRESRISKVIYASEASYNPKNISCAQLNDDCINDESSNLLKKFFSDRR